MPDLPADFNPLQAALNVSNKSSQPKQDKLILRQPLDKSGFVLGQNEEKNTSLNNALRKESDF